MTATPSAYALDGRYAWARLGVSMLLATVGCAGMWIIVVVIPAVQAEFGVSRAGASMPFTTTMMGFAAGNLLIGRLVDRIGYWLPALASSVAIGLGLIVASLAPNIEVFALAHGALVGVGSATMFGPLIADISHWFDRRRGFAVAAAACGNYFSGAFWPAVMPWLMEGWGWRGAYLTVGLISLATMIPLTLLLRRRIDHAVHAGAVRKAERRALSLSAGQLQALLVLAGFGCCMAMAMPQVHIVAYCADLGYGVARGAEMLALMLVGGVASRLGSGILADRIGGIRTLLIGSVAQGLALAAYIPFDGLASLYVVSFVFGLSQGGIVP